LPLNSTGSFEPRVPSPEPRAFAYTQPMKRIAPLLFLALLVPSRADADLTAFLGVNPTPVSRPVKGLAAGMGLLIVGFEFEYASTSDDTVKQAPSLKTYMGNGLLQTPFPIGGMQFYATAGGGVYRESLNDDTETHVGINVGGGVKMNLAGPLRLRLDYRVFTLQGSPRYSKPQRFYAGINLKF
jgi:opacity protein-like surface antigen